LRCQYSNDITVLAGDRLEAGYQRRQGVRLHRYGIDAHAGRNNARLALAAELPASVLADLTGISVGTAEHWSQVGKARLGCPCRPAHG
jgi:hypothetical protein